MNRKSIRVFAAALCLAALAVPRLAMAQELIVSAAASLTNAFGDIGKGFEAANPGTKLTLNFAASGALLQQIDKGAPVDVFASADEESMDAAAGKGLIVSASRKDFAANRLVVVVPAAAKLPIGAPADLARPEVKRFAVGNPASVPVGRYTRDALGPKLWEAVQPKLIPAESVRQVLQYVSRGEVDAGTVYATDAATAKDKVTVVATLDPGKPIRYPIAVVKGTKQEALARRFLDYVLSEPGQAVLARYGFSRP